MSPSGACVGFVCSVFCLFFFTMMSQTPLLPLLAFYISYGIAGKMKEWIVG